MKQTLKILIYCILFLGTLEGLAILSTLKPKQQLGAAPAFGSIVIRDEIGRKGRPFGKWEQIKLNRFGFNDSDDYTFDNDKRAVRILCLGDSITFGTSTQPHNWPAFLEDKLKRAGLNVEVINAAFPGNSYPEIIDRFEKEYIQFDPDLVLIYKDFRHYMALSEKSPRVNTTWIDILKISRFLNSIIQKVPQDSLKRLKKTRLLKGIKQPIESIGPISHETFRNDLNRFIRICQSRSIIPVLSDFPSLVNEDNFQEHQDTIYDTLYYYPQISAGAYIHSKATFNSIILDTAIKFDCPYVDLSTGLKQSHAVFQDDYHFTLEGTEIIAEKYAEALIPLIQGQ